MSCSEHEQNARDSVAAYVESTVLTTESSRTLFRLETRFHEIGSLGLWMASSTKRGHDVKEVHHLQSLKKPFLEYLQQHQPHPFAWEAYLSQKYPESFWQSDGKSPHFIKCAFDQLVRIRQIAIFLDFERDQSYTPIQLQVHWGMCPFIAFAMDECSAQKFNVETAEPSGWVCLMKDSVSATGDMPALLAKCVTIVVVDNHRGGNDTRIRQVRIYSDINLVEEGTT